MRVVITIAFLLANSVGLACSCLPPSGNYERYVLDQLCAADVVVVGDVESSILIRDFGFEYKIWPRETFKGRLKSPAFALTEARNTCGYRFNVDGRYLIFASRKEDTEYITASNCGLTQLLDKDGLIFEVLTQSKGNVEQLCGDDAVEARRLERLREKVLEKEQLEEDTRKFLNSGE